MGSTHVFTSAHKPKPRRHSLREIEQYVIITLVEYDCSRSRLVSHLLFPLIAERIPWKTNAAVRHVIYMETWGMWALIGT